MKRLRDAFAAPGKRLVAYLNVGDPGESTEPVDYVELALAAVDAGADVLELGVPFSDPFADGLAIAAASHRALGRGGGLRETLRVCRALRERSQVPIVLFGYANPLVVCGYETIAARAQEAGVDALLVVDLPVSAPDADDDAAALRRACRTHEVGLVPLLAPTSDRARVQAVAAVSDSVPFVYYVSVTGVTGAASVPFDQAASRAAEIEAELALPVAIGFGIDGADKARRAASGAKGVVVGTALVSALARARTQKDKVAACAEVLTPLRAALNSV